MRRARARLAASFAALALGLSGCAHPGALAPAPAGPVKAEAPSAASAPPAPAACPTRAPAFAGTSHADGLWGAKVEQVCLLGAQEDVAPHLTALVLPRQGTGLDPKAVSEDLELLYKQVVVEDATALVEPLPAPSKGVRLTYLVAEFPRYTELHLEGARAVSEDTVRSVLEVGLPANPVVLRAAIDEVRQSYASIGYARAKVDSKLVPTQPGQVRLELAIDEGPRLTVGAIRLEGAKAVKQAELRRALKSEVGAPFTQELADRDAAALNAVCFDHGLVQSSVTFKSPRAMSGADGSVELVFSIDEGPVFRLGQVKLEGFDVGPLEALQGIETKPKSVFSRSAVTRDIDRLKHLAQQKGAQVEVTPLTEVHVEQQTIDLTFSLEKKAGEVRF